MALVSEAVHLTFTLNHPWMATERSEVARSSQASPELEPDARDRHPAGPPPAAQWGHLGVVQAGPRQIMGSASAKIEPALTLRWPLGDWARRRPAWQSPAKSCAITLSQPITGRGDGKQVDPPSLAHPIWGATQFLGAMCNEWLKQGGSEMPHLRARARGHPLKLETAPENIGTPT